jgi:hypothetical protein
VLHPLTPRGRVRIVHGPCATLRNPKSRVNPQTVAEREAAGERSLLPERSVASRPQRRTSPLLLKTTLYPLGPPGTPL